MSRQDSDICGQELHRRLLEGDPVAPSELVESYMRRLVKRVCARAQVPEDDFRAQDAVTDTLLEYAQQPTKYCPAKSSLLTYLAMSAYRDLLNMMATEQRRSNREFSLEVVEHRSLDGNNLIESAEDTVLVGEGILTPEERVLLWQRVSEQFPVPTDRQLLSLILNGERRTTVYSAVLGIQDSDHDEQRRVVKRHKDRLTKRLVRLGGKLHE